MADIDADELREIREKMKLTQAELGQRMGMSKSAIYNLEAGTAEIRDVHALALRFLSLEIAVEEGDLNIASNRARRAAHAYVDLSKGVVK